MMIAPKSWWMCLEDGPGFGLPHMVVMINNRSVDAWSDYDEESEEGLPGNTWTGTRNAFLEVFEPLDMEFQPEER